MKFKLKWISLILSFIMTLSLFPSCNSNIVNVESTKRYVYDKGVHLVYAPDTEKYLVENGITEYKLLVPGKLDDNLDIAIREFQELFMQATGIRIAVVQESDETATHTAEGKYISLGTTQMMLSANLRTDYDVIGEQGVRIITKDNTIYMFSGSSLGVVYCVYEFMQIVFNYEIYYTDCIVIDENVSNVMLKDFDVTDVPDILFRDPSWGPVTDNILDSKYRFRMSYSYSDIAMPLGDFEHGAEERIIHNTNEIIPYEYWRYEHPKWFSDKGLSSFGAQLCYTARGDAAEYEALIEQIASVIVSCMKKYPVDEYPQYKIMTLTMEDDYNACGCDACINAKNLYGVEVGAVMVLCNKVMEKVQAIMQLPENQDYYRKDLQLLFFAYNNFLEAPATYDKELQKYVYNHPDLQLRDDVGVFYAIVEGLSYVVNIYDDMNDNAREQFLKWRDLTNSHLYLWTYVANYGAYLAMHDSFNCMNTEGYQFFVSGGLKLMLNQGATQKKDTTNFDGLKMFLDYKLQWDCTLDSAQLTEEWFEAMYGVAAPIMKQLYEEERMYDIALRKKINELTGNKTIFHLYNQENWPLPMLRKWVGLCEEAQALIKDMYEEYEPERYKRIQKYIDLEWISPAYLIVSQYEAGYIPDEEYNNYMEHFDVVLENVRNMTITETGSFLFASIAALKNK